jgi:hypothetical protein
MEFCALGLLSQSVCDLSFIPHLSFEFRVRGESLVVREAECIGLSDLNEP